MRTRAFFTLALFCISTLFLLSCGGEKKPENGEKTVVATTTMIADLVQVIAAEDCEVIGLMEAGVDPHTYELPAKAIGQLRGANLIIYNGMMLEGKLAESFADMGDRAVAVTAQLPKDRILAPESAEYSGDPHVWGDASLWAEAIPSVVTALSRLIPEKAETFKARGTEYQQEVLNLHQWIQKKVAEIPAEQRLLVTSHDAFSYLGEAYGIEVIGVQGISTSTSAGMADIVKTVDLIKEKGVKAIFVESSVNKQTIERISKDAGVTIGGELYSDSCGPAGEIKTVDGETYDVGTYIGMMKHNINTAREALK